MILLVHQTEEAGSWKLNVTCSTTVRKMPDDSSDVWCLSWFFYFMFLCECQPRYIWNCFFWHSPKWDWKIAHFKFIFSIDPVLYEGKALGKPQNIILQWKVQCSSVECHIFRLMQTLLMRNLELISRSRGYLHVYVNILFILVLGCS